MSLFSLIMCSIWHLGGPHTVLPIGPKLVPGVATLPYGIFFLQACGSDAELLSTTRSLAKPIQPILAAPCRPRPCSSSMSSADRHHHVCSKKKLCFRKQRRQSHVHDNIISKYLALCVLAQKLRTDLMPNGIVSNYLYMLHLRVLIIYLHLLNYNTC